MKNRSTDKHILKTKQQNYLIQWKKSEPRSEYSALQDPHANSYFCRKSVRTLLTQLKNELDHEKNHTQSWKLKKLITSKLQNMELPTISKCTKGTQVYTAQIDRLSFVPKLTQHKPQMIKSTDQRYRTNHNQTFNDQIIQQRKSSYRSKLETIDSTKFNLSMDEEVRAISKHQKLYKQVKQVELDQQNRKLEKANRENHTKFVDFLRKKIETVKKVQHPSTDHGNQIEQEVQYESLM